MENKANTGPTPERFQVYEEDPSGRGFYLPTGEYFVFDKHNGWFDEQGYYYNSEAQPCNPPYPVNPSMFINNQHNNPQQFANNQGKKYSDYVDPVLDMYGDDDDDRYANHDDKVAKQQEEMAQKLFARQNQKNKIVERINEKYVKGDAIPFVVDFKLMGPELPKEKELLDIFKSKVAGDCTLTMPVENQLNDGNKYFKVYIKNVDLVDKILDLQKFSNPDIAFLKIELLDLLNLEKELPDEEYEEGEYDPVDPDHPPSDDDDSYSDDGAEGDDDHPKEGEEKKAE